MYDDHVGDVSVYLFIKLHAFNEYVPNFKP